MHRWLVALSLGLGCVASAAKAQESLAAMRASGLIGEQADGYLGLRGVAPAAVRQQVDAVNDRRRAYFAGLAADRATTVEDVAAQQGCDAFRSKVQPGEYYRLPDGVWRRRDAAPIALPSYCR